MATPSSSATSPSPPMAYLQPLVPMVSPNQGPSSPSSSSISPSTGPVERDRRKKAVQKFLARAELSNVTRTLRSRLSHASSKTSNNVPFAFGDYEPQTQNPSTLIPTARSYAAKRKPPSQPVGNTVTSPLRRGSLGPVPPRTPAISSSVGASTSAAAGSAEPNTQTLFTSILAPPPPNQARTILNVNDPPVAAPVRPPMSPKVRGTNNGKALKTIAESTRAHGKSRTHHDKRKDKGKNRKNVDADGDVDMEAAATLTSLLLHHRPSIASASSPRSSVDGGSEPGTSFSQQSHSAHSSFASITSTAPSTTASTSYRGDTPPRSSNIPAQQQQTTPGLAPTDNEAADLMLFLATSPSPARPSTSKNARDAAAFRALGNPASHPTNANNGNMMRAKPRVLFPTQGDANDDHPSGRRNSRTGQGLARTDSNAGSSMSSIGGETSEPRTIARPPPPPDRINPTSQHPHFPHQQSQPSATAVPAHAHGAHLLPPPSLPAQSHLHPSSNYPSSPSSLRQESSSSSRSGHGAVSSGDREFFNEYVHGSPGRSGSPLNATASKANIGLRADVGRKLFEEEQIRLQQKRGPDDRGFDGGVDLVRT
ncbi:hypothetical protein GYMLUDRAFT_76671 [Collybiopsis luxurians FD-317 M1]|uniref:Uncharacterized protein n=1 Tax=Collybiopsis luxurians FD-317 M1 TaxID=944289 RepID=A0A0D0CAS0_9AGAR|nr:hypothetical protein GYMLUDRAFT_76671 [Collybiopsis luxurians FD-317 M1]